jgi:hypothetical protein
MSRSKLVEERTTLRAHAFGAALRLVERTAARAQLSCNFSDYLWSDYLGQLNLPSLFAAAFSVVFQNERDFVAFIQRPDTRALECGGVYKHVLRAVSG